MSESFDSLQGNLRGNTRMSTEDDIPIYTAEEVARHNTAGDLWVSINGNVYDFTEFQYKHPGGQKWILDRAGGDETKLFRAAHMRDDPEAENLIGRLAPKAPEVEVVKKRSFLKRLFKRGKGKGKDISVEHASKDTSNGFRKDAILESATAWQAPNTTNTQRKRDRDYARTITATEEEMAAKEENPSVEEKFTKKNVINDGDFSHEKKITEERLRAMTI